MRDVRRIVCVDRLVSRDRQKMLQGVHLVHIGHLLVQDELDVGRPSELVNLATLNVIYILI